MRRILILIGAIAITIGVSAQGAYTLQVQSSTYTELTNDSVLTKGDWGNYDTLMQLPFAFIHFGDTADKILIKENGIYFGAQGLGQVTPFDEDMQNRSDTGMVSAISWFIGGTGTERIFKIQYRNIGMFDSSIAYPDNFVNYQIWLYEGSNRIEFHHGTSHIATATKTTLDFKSGIMKADGTDALYLYGNPASPQTENDPFTTVELDAFPAAGTVYAFIPLVVNSVKMLTLSYMNITVYPNPFTHHLWVDASSTIENIWVHDANGKEVYVSAVHESSVEVETDGWAPGAYFITITTPDGKLSRKVYK